MKQVLVLLLVMYQCAVNAQDIYPGENGEELLSYLVSDYKPSSELPSYGDTRDSMYRLIYRDPLGFVTCYYTGHTIYLPEGVDPSAYLYDDGNPDGITAEHVYPQSKGAEYGNPKVDLHSLVPCTLRANEARSNYPFGEVADEETDHWYTLTEDLEDIPNFGIDNYSERLNGGWGNLGIFEPRESVKGDIARAVFYFYTMYKEEADLADADYFGSMKADLFRWHLNDPVDSLELELNIKKAKFQENKINPFIMDCSLVARAYFTDAEGIEPCRNGYGSVGTHNNEAGDIILYPNPLNDVLYIDNQSDRTIDQIIIRDISGKIRLNASKLDDIAINCSALSKGSYILTAIQKESIRNLKFVKI